EGRRQRQRKPRIDAAELRLLVFIQKGGQFVTNRVLLFLHLSHQARRVGVGLSAPPELEITRLVLRHYLAKLLYLIIVQFQTVSNPADELLDGLLRRRLRLRGDDRRAGEQGKDTRDWSQVRAQFHTPLLESCPWANPSPEAVFCKYRAILASLEHPAAKKRVKPRVRRDQDTLCSDRASSFDRRLRNFDD